MFVERFCKKQAFSVLNNNYYTFSTILDQKLKQGYSSVSIRLKSTKVVFLALARSEHKFQTILLFIVGLVMGNHDVRENKSHFFTVKSKTC